MASTVMNLRSTAFYWLVVPFDGPLARAVVFGVHIDGHLVVEVLLVAVILFLLFQKSYKPPKRPLTERIGFRLFLVPTISAKKHGVEVAQSLKATWVILDRKIKKESKYFMENLSCGVSNVKHDGRLKFMRGPKPVISHKLFSKTSLSYNEMISDETTTCSPSSFGQHGRSHLSYNEMIPSGPGDQPLQ